MSNQRTRVYFIRTKNRSRILATLVCRTVNGKLAFGLARASASESSPSRREGREKALERLEQVIQTNGPIYHLTYRRDRPNGLHNMLGGILEVSRIVPVLYRLVTGYETCMSIPVWAFIQDSECFGDDHTDCYLDMFAKLRGHVAEGKF